MKAVVQKGDGKVAYVTDRPSPKLRPDYIKVETKAVALNPTDWKHAFGRPDMNNPDHLIGCDYSGVVIELGDSLTKKFKVGDRVCGFTHGSNTTHKEDGSFAEQIVVKTGCTLHLPDSYSFEDATTFGVSVMTCGQGLYQAMELAWPSNPTKGGEWVLIYGGSSAMGTMGVQLAKLSGYKVVTTCSKRNFDLVKGYGADEVFDYSDYEAAVEGIKKVTGGGVGLAWDTISEEKTAKLCADVLVKGGRYGSILLGRPLVGRDDVKQTTTLGYTAIGDDFVKAGKTWDGQRIKDDYKFMTKWYEEGDRLLKEGKLKPHPIKVSKGFEGIEGGMVAMKEGKVSGQKLVFTTA